MHGSERASSNTRRMWMCRELHTRLRVERAGPGRVEWAHLRLRLQGRQRSDGAGKARGERQANQRAAGEAGRGDRRMVIGQGNVEPMGRGERGRRRLVGDVSCYLIQVLHTAAGYCNIDEGGERVHGCECVTSECVRGETESEESEVGGPWCVGGCDGDHLTLSSACDCSCCCCYGMSDGKVRGCEGERRMGE